MSIQVRVKSVYGNTLIYPVCEKAKAFADIACQTTLTAHVIKNIKALGYTITVVSEPVEL